MNAALGLELRRSRTLLFWLAVVVLAYGGFIAGFYPVIVENYALIEEYMAVFPKALMAAFGMEGSLADPGIFFATYIGSWLWPIVAAIVGAILATRPVAADLERGFVELPLSTSLSRVRYLASAILVQAVVLGALAVATVGGVIVVGAAVDAGFDPGRFLLVVPVAFAFGCAFAAVTTLLSVLTLSRGLAAGTTVGVLLAMYLLDVVSALEPDLDWLGTISVFRYFNPRPIIDEGAFPWPDVALFGVVAVVGWGLALLVFRRRDLAA